jgi:exodeoxyribonuclease VII large subunit
MNAIYSVAQVNSYIKNMFLSDARLSRIYVKGEVSNCKYHSSGHIYFTLKDGNSAMACVMFASYRHGLAFTLADGQGVVVGGEISVYERDGRYQLYAREISLDGAGALYAEYERLKMKLYEEGLFEHDDKKPIPMYPAKVGIVTASTGAAIQDIMSIARRRNPYVQLILYPAKVQGEGAAATIVKGIRTLDKMGVDTIIIGRGGGSIEDLWAFNEEIVVRAIYEANTPIISGTGHESDTTLADYAADLRAATPSAATELAIPDIRATLDTLESIVGRFNRIIWNKVEQYRLYLKNYDSKLQRLSPQSRLREQQQYLASLQDKLQMLVQDRMRGNQHRLEVLTERLHGLAPTRKLINGYGYVTKDRKPVTEVSMVKDQDEIMITLLKGNIHATVTGIEE